MSTKSEQEGGSYLTRWTGCRTKALDGVPEEQSPGLIRDRNTKSRHRKEAQQQQQQLGTAWW